MGLRPRPPLGADSSTRPSKPADPLYRVWGHPRDVEGETVRGDGVATLEATDVPDHTGVEIRVTVPRTPGQGVAGARAGNGDGLPKILAEEKALDDDYNSFPNRVKRFLANHVLTVLLGLAALAVLVVGLLALLARERPSAAPKYLPEPPDDASPAVAYGIVHEGGDSTDTVLATLLDLVDRGYYETSSATTDEEKLDLASEAATEPPRAASSTDHEREVLSFFDQLLDGETVAISEMKDRIPEHSEIWRGRWERMTETLDAADEGSSSGTATSTGPRWVAGSRSSLLFAAVTLICDRRSTTSGCCRRTAVSTAGRDRARTRDATEAGRRRTPRTQRALAGVRALDRGLPAPRRRPAGDARVVEADPRLRGRVRDGGADDQLGPDPGAGRRGVALERRMERLRVHRRVRIRVFQRLAVQLGLRVPGRTRELLSSEAAAASRAAAAAASPAEAAAAPGSRVHPVLPLISGPRCDPACGSHPASRR